MKLSNKITALFLCLVLAALPLTALAAANGDLSGDNAVDASDARLILRAAVGIDKLTAAQQNAADMDMDGEVTAADARMALRTAVELEYTDGKLYTNEYDVLRSGFFFADMAVADASGRQDMTVAVTDRSAYVRMAFSDPEMAELFGKETVDIEMMETGGAVYLLDGENKLYGEFPFEEMGMTKEDLGGLGDSGSMFANYPSLDKASGTENAKYNGAPCRAYVFPVEDGGTLKIFMDGKKVIAIVNYDAKGDTILTYEFNKVTLTVPAQYAGIPVGYTEGDPLEILFLLFLGDMLADD